jgi:ABC-type uncharacterized transport system substrate-binding protein
VENSKGHLSALGDKLVKAEPNAIFAVSTLGTMAAKWATATLPIVVAAAIDPVRSGVTASYSSRATI